MVVTALSLSGLTFEIQIAQPVRDGQHVSVAFQVEPADKSRVWQSGVVRSVSGNRVEATWHNPETLDTILLRYLTTE